MNLDVTEGYMVFFESLTNCPIVRVNKADGESVSIKTK